MKKSKLLSGLLITSLLFSSLPVFAADVVVKNQPLQLDQPAVIENNRTLVPMRAIFEALGAQVSWNNATRTVKATKNGKEILLTIGSKQALVNGSPQSLDVAPKIYRNRTLVPVRFVSQTFGSTVNWDGVSQTVYIDSTPPAAPGDAFIGKYSSVVYSSQTRGSSYIYSVTIYPYKNDKYIVWTKEGNNFKFEIATLKDNHLLTIPSQSYYFHNDYGTNQLTTDAPQQWIDFIKAKNSDLNSYRIKHVSNPISSQVYYTYTLEGKHGIWHNVDMSLSNRETVWRISPSLNKEGVPNSPRGLYLPRVS